MRRFSTVFALVVVGFASIASVSTQAATAHFSGGTCASQGDWVQTALDQSAMIVSALETLRDDPNCTALVKTLDNSAQLAELTKSGSVDGAGMSGVFQELQSIREYLGNSSTHGPVPANFKEIVNYMVFRKSLETVKDIRMTQQFESLNPEQKENIEVVSQRLKNFLKRASTVSNVAVTTMKGMMAAMPQSKMCFNSRPNQAALIFSSVVNSAAALASGGQITNVGEMVSSLVDFTRQMHFANILSGVELERYRASMSCLVESTQEAYCSLQDAQDALNFTRGMSTKEGRVVEIAPQTSAENSMQGLMVLLRDVPIITAWMQKILFGIDPKLEIEAEMKNANWDSIINFIKSKNTLPAIYRDKRQVYYQSTAGMDRSNKVAMLKDIVNSLSDEMLGNKSAGTINFFRNAMNSDSMPFFLIGADVPVEYNSYTNNFNNIFLKWSRDESHGFANPDAMVEAIGEHLNDIIDRASALSSSYFSSRMIVDSQNLIVEGMNGPSISPYKALFHVNTYLERLIAKLQQGLANPNVMADPTNENAYRTTIPLLQDLHLRIEKITTAMSEATAVAAPGAEIGSSETASRKKMDVVYEVANMLNSRDSFIANRIASAVRMDISDTLWRNEKLDDRQEQVLKVMGKDVITRLSRYFNNDPILQRLDVAQAAPIHEQNVSAVEDLFVDSYWDQLSEINCKLFGSRACQNYVQPPAMGFWRGYLKQITDFFTFQPFVQAAHFFKKPTDDAAPLYNLRAKLCAQTLGFQQYGDRFVSLCRDSVLQSEFDDAQGTKGLNFSYNDSHTELLKLRSSQTPGHLSSARTYGACALRSYIRKNIVYRMYTDLAQ